MENTATLKRNFDLVWSLKQVLPLRYETFYGEDGKYYFTRWYMWFGICFSILKVEITKEQWVSVQ